jgi:hypothetical protein
MSDHGGTLVALVEYLAAEADALKRILRAGDRRLVQLVEELRLETRARHAAEARVVELEKQLAARDEPLARSA